MVILDAPLPSPLSSGCEDSTFCIEFTRPWWSTTVAMTKPCVQCGKPLGVEDAFCEDCGAPQKTPLPSKVPSPVAGRGGLGLVTIILAFAMLVAGGWWWGHRPPPFVDLNPPAYRESLPPVQPTALTVPTGQIQPTTSQPEVSPAITELMVQPWVVTLDGRFGLRAFASSQGLPKTGTTQFSGWVKELDGTGVATLDREQSSPDGGLGFQTTSTDGSLLGFIPARAIGLPPGDYTLKMEVLATNSGAEARSSANFLFRLGSCRPDRVEVSPGTNASGLRMVEFQFDITAQPLMGRTGILMLRFKHATTQTPIASSNPSYADKGQLTAATRFNMPQNTQLDGLRLAVPFEVFPDADCLMDIEFYDENMTKLNWSNGVPFHPRG